MSGDPLNKPMWPVGFFGQNSKAFTQNLEELFLDDEELRLLTALQAAYALWQKDPPGSAKDTRFQHLRSLNGQLRDHEYKTKLHEDGFKQQLEWQTLLY